MYIDLEIITNIEFDGIDHADAPDYCDSYISSCDVNGELATQEQLDEINEDRDFVYDKLMDYLR